MIGISACLGGVCCRYDGKTKENPVLKNLVLTNQAIMICPEVMGGLPTPREPSEIIGGDGFDVWKCLAKVMTKTGIDVTEEFKKGSIAAYQQLIDKEIVKVILKDHSPSCGRNLIYDGNFSGFCIKGIGVATAYFLLNGIEVISDTEWEKAL